MITTVINENKAAGDYITQWTPAAGLSSGEYLVTFAYDNAVFQTIKINLLK